jgi:hypothetical protein
LTGGFTTGANDYAVNPLALTATAIGSSSSTYAAAQSPGTVSFGTIASGDTVTDTAIVNTTGNSSGGHPNIGTFTQTTGALAGTDAGNYSLTPLTSAANYTISPLGITGSVTASNKTYNATDTASIATRTLSGVISGDTVSYTGGTATFSDKNVGTGKMVTATGLGLAGTDKNNYTVNPTATTTANINPANLTASIVGNPTKTYDGTAAATLGAGNYSLIGFVGTESLTVTQTSGSYDGKDAGARTVTAILAGGNFTAGAGTLLGNYSLPTNASGAGTILVDGTLTVTAPASTTDAGAVATIITSIVAPIIALPPFAAADVGGDFFNTLLATGAGVATPSRDESDTDAPDSAPEEGPVDAAAPGEGGAGGPGADPSGTGAGTRAADVERISSTISVGGCGVNSPERRC